MERDHPTALLIRAREAYGLVLADPERAGEEVALLSEETRRARDRRALVAALRAEAWYERSRLAHDRARRLLDEAVRIARRHGLHPELRHALTSRGAIRHEQGELTAAQRDFDEASTLAPRDGDPELDSQQAALHQNTGRLGAAAVVYRRILSRSDTPPDVRTKAANNLAIIEVQRGRPAAALSWFEHAAEAAQQVGPAYIAIVAEGRACATVRAGQLVRGVELFARATELWQAAGLNLGELYAEYADALVDLRLVPEATREARRARASLAGRGVALMAAEAELRLAHLALLGGDADAAVVSADELTADLRRQGRTTWAARARLVATAARLSGGRVRPADLRSIERAAADLEAAGLQADAVDAYLTCGRTANALGRSDAAIEAWNRATALGRSAPVLVRLKGRLSGALAAVAAGNQDAVLRHARAGLTDLDRHRRALPSAELRALASGHGAELGGLGLAAVIRSRRPTDVLMWMERTRAAALAVVDPPEVPGVEDDLAELRVVHAEATAARRDAHPDLATLLGRQASIEERIRRATWRPSTGRAAALRPPSPTELREVLDGQLLVELDVVEGDVIAVVVEPRRTRSVVLGSVAAVRRAVDALYFALRRLARRPNATSAAAVRLGAVDALAELGRQLVEPLVLTDSPGVVVVPVGDLQRVPWSALFDVPVTVVPSAAVWMRTTASPLPHAGDVALIAGPELPGAAAEIRALGALYGDATVLVAPGSDVAAVTNALSRSRTAHLACHGHVRADNPLFSSLLVSDGPLTVQQLHQQAVAPHRLVLAACESASDRVYPGNEMLGFVSSLLALGTSGIVASSVVIPDWNVVPMMVALHTSLRAGATLPVALHNARARVEREDDAGYVSWCAFNAYGAA